MGSVRRHRSGEEGSGGLSEGRPRADGPNLRPPPERMALRDRLTTAGCQAMAMEATGSYGKPVGNVLEDHAMTLLLAHPQRFQAIPGRKSEVRDADWIADRLRQGLVPASYVPDRAQRELRELTRYRTSLPPDRAREVNRLAKVLDGGHIKLGRVLTDLTGVTGRTMLRAIAQGEDDPATRLAYRVGPVNTPAAFGAALTGILTPHQRG